jgi:DNA-binding transcriptional MocR family regulator
VTHRYEAVAAELKAAIVRGAYPAGARLPSVRQLRDQFGISVATALEAYSQLEIKGLVEARPKSGYFVRPTEKPESLPVRTEPSLRVQKVSITQRVMDVYWATPRPGSVSLASAQATTEAVEAFAKSMARVARTYGRNSNNYEHPQGSVLLREQVSRLLACDGCNVLPDDIVITHGAQEAVLLALRSSTKPNDIVVVETPTFFGTLQAIEALGLRAIEIPTDPQHGSDLEVLDQVTKKSRVTACVLSPRHQNPLGFNMSDDDKQRLVAILEKNDVTLIEDDVFGPIGLNPLRPAKAFDETGNVIHCGSFSKTLVPGARIGWAAAGEKFDQLLRYKFVSSLGSTLLPQLAIADLLSRKRFDRICRRTALVYTARLRTLRSAVLKFFPEGTKCTSPKGGMALWVQMPDNIDSMTLLVRAREGGITFIPGSHFSAANLHRNCMRLSVGGVDETEIPQVIERLAGIAADAG